MQLAITDHPEWSFDWTTFSAPPAGTGGDGYARRDSEPASPLMKSDCRNGGWDDYGFSNQGQCISYLMTSKDRR